MSKIVNIAAVHNNGVAEVQVGINDDKFIITKNENNTIDFIDSAGNALSPTGVQKTITGAASTITTSKLTASRALVSNSSGKVAVSTVTSKELGYLDGVTSNIQTQLDGKASSSHALSKGTGTTSSATLGFGDTFSVVTGTSTSEHTIADNTTTYTMPSDRLFTTLVPTGTEITTVGTDLQSTTYLKVGRYYCSLNDTAKTLKHCPTNLAFMMEVYSPLTTTIDDETTTKYVYRLRKITEYKTGIQYIQYVGSGATAGKFTYEDWYAVPRAKVTLDSTDTNDGSAAVGSATNPVYVDEDGTLTKCTYTLGKSVPSDAKFTDTTYSAATTSAAGLMSADDKTKLDSIATGANKISVDSALSSTSTNPVQNKVINTALSGKSDTDHTHKYAGSSSAGGAATSADKLNTNAGSATNPVYFADGIPKATTYTLGKSVPSDAKFTDTVYTHPTASGNKHIPSGGSSGQILRWAADGTAEWGADNNTTYSAATTSAAGLMSADDKTKLNGIATGANKYTHPTASGNKHIPSGGSSGQILRWSADGTAEWGADNNTTYSAATTSAAGLMSAADKTKLDGIATGATKYTHPTTSGNKHIPSGGSSGQILKWSADGTAAWGDNTPTYSAGTGISISNNTISNSGVRSISTGSISGTISVNTNGSSANVAVKGLGSAAYVDASTLALKSDIGLFESRLSALEESIVTVHSGTIAPLNTVGEDGDIYLYTGE